MEGRMLNGRLIQEQNIMHNKNKDKVMKNVFPSKVRKVIYSVSLIAMPVLAYLAEQGSISSFVFGLAVVVNSAVLGLARINVNK